MLSCRGSSFDLASRLYYFYHPSLALQSNERPIINFTSVSTLPSLNNVIATDTPAISAKFINTQTGLYDYMMIWEMSYVMKLGQRYRLTSLYVLWVSPCHYIWPWTPSTIIPSSSKVFTSTGRSSTRPQFRVLATLVSTKWESSWFSLAVVYRQFLNPSLDAQSGEYVDFDTLLQWFISRSMVGYTSHWPLQNF